MESPIEVVRRFCVAWSEDMGADDLAAFFTDDAVYHNIPLAPVRGTEAIANNFATFIRPGPPGVQGLDLRLINIAADAQSSRASMEAPCEKGSAVPWGVARFMIERGLRASRRRGVAPQTATRHRSS